MARLIPRETKFFDMFAEIASNVTKGAKTLSGLLENWEYERLPAIAAEIGAIEHRGDVDDSPVADKAQPNLHYAIRPGGHSPARVFSR